MQVLADVAEVLTPLAEATELLTTESTPAAGAVYYLLKELADDLAVVEAPEGAEAETQDQDMDSDEEDDSDTTATVRHDMEVPPPESEYDSPVAGRLKRAIWTKVQARFSLEADGQPEDDVCRSCPLLIAAFCDPRYYLIANLYFKFTVQQLQINYCQVAIYTCCANQIAFVCFLFLQIQEPLILVCPQESAGYASRL